MLKIGRKAGTYFVSTVLASYNLDVYVDVDDNRFSVLTPSSPGGKVVPRDRASFTLHQGSDLQAVKRQAREYLQSRDVTGFRDVIECEVEYDDDKRNAVSFSFEVCRVSEAVDGQGNPKLEKPIEVAEDGQIREVLLAGEPVPPRSHRGPWRSSVLIPYTVERWRKCQAIRDGIVTLRSALRQLFEGDDVGPRLDALRGARLLSALQQTEGDSI